MTPNFTSEFAVTNLEDVSLNFHVDEVKKFVIDFSADTNDINQEIQVSFFSGIEIFVDKSKFISRSLLSISFLATIRTAQWT